MTTVNRQRNLHYVLASSLLFFAPSAALATTPHWQGPYVGGYLGGGFGNSQISTTLGSTTDTSYFASSANINAVSDAGTSTENSASWIMGIKAGHDWIWKQMVYGVVFDYTLLPLSSSNTENNAYPDNSGNYSLYTSMNTNWLFTLRGRVGYQDQVSLRWPNLLYLTGGMAITQLKITNDFSDTSSYAGTGESHNTENKIGWTLGAGIELATSDHLSVDIEYLYVCIPSINTTGSIYNSAGGFGIPAQSLTSPFSTTGDFHTSLFKIGLNYRFDE